MGRPGTNPDELPNRVREYRLARKMTLKDLAAALGLGGRHQTVEKLETGKTELSAAWRRRIAPILAVKPLDLLRPEQAILVTVPIVGFVGAGGEVKYYGAKAELDRVEPPAECEDPTAVLVKGSAMLPRYYEGDVLFFDKDRDGVADECLGRDCIVQTAGGKVVVRRLFRGSREGLYRLQAPNGAETEDAVSWAAKVLFTKQG